MKQIIYQSRILVKHDIFRMTFDDVVFEEYFILYKFTIYVEINHLNPKL